MVSALIEKTIDAKTKSLHKYKLNEIDEVREDILGAGKNEWTTKGSWRAKLEKWQKTNEELALESQRIKMISLHPVIHPPRAAHPMREK